MFHVSIAGTHVPARKMQRQISRNYYWRGYFVDLVRYVRDCEVCAEEESHKQTRLTSVLSQYNKENVPPEQAGVLDRLAKVWKKVRYRNTFQPQIINQFKSLTLQH